MLLSTLICGGGAAACLGPLMARQSRLSAAVAFARQSQETQAFLSSPEVGYIQAFFRFDDRMPDDVIIAVDQEHIEGVARPLTFSGADWMAFVGVQRAGGVWVAAGTAETAKGNPSTDRNWKIFDLRTRLQSNIWYRVRVEADFRTRQYRSFSIEGGALKRMLDLSGLMLDYPNYMPFSQAAMTYFVVAMRGRSMMKVEGVPIVYFDDVEGGIVRPGGVDIPLFADSFEGQARVSRQPITSPIIDISAYRDGYWYLEREESLVTIAQVPFARTGKFVAVLDAGLN